MEEIKLNCVYNCDCLELMRAMVAAGLKVDWCITDPPYGIGEDGKKNHSRGFATASRQYTPKEWDKQRIGEEYFDLIRLVSNNQIIFGGNYYTDYLPPTANWVIWDKRCQDSMRNDFADGEMAWASKGGTRIFHYLYNGMLQDDMKNKDDRFHPTQKPTQLWFKLIDYYTKPGDIILDPFMGSFTTAVCAYKSGRKFIGAELDKEYYELGQKRLEKVMRQISFFD